MMPQPVSPPAPLQRAEVVFRGTDYRGAQSLALAVFEDSLARLEDRCAAGLIVLLCRHRQADYRGLVQHLPQALALCDGAGDTARAFELVRVASLACSEHRNFDEALRLARDAHARAGLDPLSQMLASVTQAACYERMGDPWQARRMLDPLLPLAREAGATWILLRVLNGMTSTLIAMHHVLVDAGDQPAARETISQAQLFAVEALPIAQAHGDQWLLVLVQATLAETHLRLGHLEQAAAALNAALQSAQAHEMIALQWRLRCLAAEIELARGSSPAAKLEVEAVLAEVDLSQPTSTLLRLHQVAYRAYVAEGDIARALAHLETYLAMERQRSAEQLRAQAQELVSRVEVENALRAAERATGEAREYRRRADALADVALKDALTGVLNRRGLDERMAALRKQPSALVAVMVDVDFFKFVNDTYGHAVGDRVLARLGALFREHLRPRDTVARYGGEEFVFLLAGLTLDEAAEVCERLRLKVEALDWDALAPSLTLTISIGVAESPIEAAPGNDGAASGAVSAAAGVLPSADVPPDISALLQPADAALYRAKALGRNRVEVSPPPPR